MQINRTTGFSQWLNKIIYSPAYFVYLGVLTVLSNAFSLEMYVYPVIILTGICVCLWGRDLLAIFPIFACGYISPSYNNNPGKHETSIFSFSGYGIFLWILLALLVASLVYRLVTDRDFGGKKFLQKRRVLLPGMLVLGITYAISGLASGQWTEHGLPNLLFAFIQFVAIATLYYLLSGAVRWDCVPKDYLAWTGICVGYVLLAELLSIYIKEQVVVGGIIARDKIATGWGHYNSIGALMTIIIPLPFLLTRKKCAGFAYLTALVFYITLLLTCSRISIAVGTVIYIAAYILSLVQSHQARRQIMMHIGAVALLITAVVIFRDKLWLLFSSFQEAGMDSMAERMNTYRLGIRQFLRFPVFGGSFFPVEGDLYVYADVASFTALFPPRWHNTLVQLLATGGVSCLAAYLYHRVQTVKLFVKNFSMEKLFAGLSVLALLLTSMADCHFFNVGPVLIYSAVLAFVEFQMNEPKKLK